jgi:hypothetical protein
MNAENQDEIRSEDERDVCDATEIEKQTMLYCPVCSTRLAPLKCKPVCEQCGYYMSCADYY